MPNTREKLIELPEKSLNYDGTNREMRFTGGDVTPVIANGVTFAKDNNVPNKWIPVEDEQKPKDRRNYFIAYVFGDSDMHFFGEAKYHAYEGNGVVDRPHFSNEGVNGMRVTHWMEIPKLPLPEPPKGE